MNFIGLHRILISPPAIWKFHELAPRMCNTGCLKRCFSAADCNFISCSQNDVQLSARCLRVSPGARNVRYSVHKNQAKS
jgi:hypothetical protein